MTPAAAANLPKIENLKRNIRRARQDNDQPGNPIDRATIPVLPNQYTQTTNGQRFLLHDTGVGDPNRIIMFSTNQALDCLNTSDHWFDDGTFKVCPEMFFQLYSVHALINKRVSPCVFVLLPHKTGITYQRFFNELSNHINNGPISMMFDFEIGAINAACQAFPGLGTNGCFSIFASMSKKVQAVGLQQRYNDDAGFALHIRMIMALAFVRPADVIATFEDLCDEIRQRFQDDLDEVLDYFEDTYIGRPRRNRQRAAPTFSINLWNVFQRAQTELPRTNNNIEGWHHHFQGICMGHHLTFWKFITKLQSEADLNRLDMIQGQAGHPPPARRQRYQDVNRRIVDIVEDYRNRDRFDYLRGIAYNIGN